MGEMASGRLRSTAVWEEASRFPRVKLSVDKLDEFHSDAEQLLTKTMKAYHQSNVLLNPKRWKSVRSKDNLYVYRDRVASSKTQAPVMICVGTMPGQLEEVLEGLYCETTRDFCMMHAICSKRFTDGAVLHVVQRRSREEPYSFTGIKWFSMHVPGGRMIADRDVCVFEKVGLVHDPDTKRRLGFKLFQSIEIPECPPQLRMKAHVCYVMEEIEPGTIGVYMTGSFDWNGPAMLAHVANPTIAYYLLRVGETSKCLRARKFTERCISFRGPRNKTRHTCDICREWNHSVFHSFEPCHGCEKSSLCRRCCKMEWILAPELQPHGGIVERPFCSMCVAEVESSSKPKQRRRHTDWSAVRSPELSQANRHGMSVATTTVDDFEQLDSFFSMEEYDDSEYADDILDMSDWPGLDTSERSRSLSTFTMNVTSQLKEFQSQPDTTHSPEQSFVEEAESEVGDVSYHEDVFEELSEVEEEVPMLSRDSGEHEQPQGLLIRNPITDIPETTHIPTATTHQEKLYHRMLRVRTIAEATFVVTCEQSKIAKTMWERTSNKYGYS